MKSCNRCLMNTDGQSTRTCGWQLHQVWLSSLHPSCGWRQCTGSFIQCAKRKKLNFFERKKHTKVRSIASNPYILPSHLLEEPSFSASLTSYPKTWCSHSWKETCRVDSTTCMRTIRLYNTEKMFESISCWRLVTISLTHSTNCCYWSDETISSRWCCIMGWRSFFILALTSSTALRSVFLSFMLMTGLMCLFTLPKLVKELISYIFKFLMELQYGYHGLFPELSLSLLQCFME